MSNNQLSWRCINAPQDHGINLVPDNPAQASIHALILCAYLCTNICNSSGNSCQRVNLVLCHKPPWLILLSQICSTAQRYVMWLITCLLCVCSALYCELSAGPSCQAVSSRVAGCSCLPDRPSPTPPLLHLHEVHLVRAASWHISSSSFVICCALVSFGMMVVTQAVGTFEAELLGVVSMAIVKLFMLCTNAREGERPEHSQAMCPFWQQLKHCPSLQYCSRSLSISFLHSVHWEVVAESTSIETILLGGFKFQTGVVCCVWLVWNGPMSHGLFLPWKLSLVAIVLLTLWTSALAIVFQSSIMSDSVQQ